MPGNHPIRLDDVIINPYRFATGGGTDPGTANLLAYWSLEDRFDDHASYDLTENGTPTYVAAKSGNGVDLVAASSEYLNNSAFSDTFHQNPFSVSVWVKFDSSTPGLMGVVGQYGSTGVSRHWLVYSNSTHFINFALRNSTTTYTTPWDSTIVAGTWYHVVGVRESDSTLNLYVDGVLASTPATFSGTENTSAQDLELGRFAAGNYFDGIIDEVRIYDDALTADEVMFLYNYPSGVVPVNPGTANLLAWWGLDDLNDDHSSSYNLTDGGSIAYTTGKVGNGALFDGSTDYLYNNSVSNTFHQNPFSISLWYKGDAFTANTHPLVGQWDSASDSVKHWGVQINTSDDKVDFLLRAGSTNYVAGSDSALVAGTWYHIVVVRDAGGAMTVYVDGNPQADTATFSGTENTGAQELTLGVFPGFSNYADGTMDELAIFTDALTLSEISWLYNSGSGRAYSDL